LTAPPVVVAHYVTGAAAEQAGEVAVQPGGPDPVGVVDQLGFMRRPG
jgi:hypothetical protein